MKTCRIGRGADNDIVCFHDEVSTHHAELIENNGSYTFIDHSKNGTIVNHTRIHNTSCSVNPGDSILFGGVEALDWKKVSKIFHTTIPINILTKRPTATLRGNKDRITIGRDLQNDIVYDSLEISSSHAEIIDREGVYTLIDHSKNGTFVNGSRIHNESCSVNYGDSIVFAGVEELNWRKVARLLNKTVSFGATKRIHNATGTVQRGPTLPNNPNIIISNNNVSSNGSDVDTDHNSSYGLVVFLLGLVALGLDVYLIIDFFTHPLVRIVGYMGASKVAWFPAYLNGCGLVQGKWLFMIASLVIGGIADFVANVTDKDDDKLTSAGTGLANTAVTISIIFLILAIAAPYIYSTIH